MYKVVLSIFCLIFSSVIISSQPRVQFIIPGEQVSSQKKEEHFLSPKKQGIIVIRNLHGPCVIDENSMHALQYGARNWRLVVNGKETEHVYRSYSRLYKAAIMELCKEEL